LKFVVDWLDKQGYEVAVFPGVDPVHLGLPVRRARVYLCAALLGPDTKTNFAMEAPMVYQSMRGPPLSLATVDDFLQRSSSTPRSQLGQNPSLRARPVKRQKHCKWEADFLLHLLARPLDLERNSALEVSQERFVGEQVLTERELHVLQIAVDSKRNVRFVDVSQSAGRAPSAENIVLLPLLLFGFSRLTHKIDCVAKIIKPARPQLSSFL
jgi:hypothetical protein